MAVHIQAFLVARPTLSMGHHLRVSSLASLAGTITRMRLRDFRMQVIAPYRGVRNHFVFRHRANAVVFPPVFVESSSKAVARFFLFSI